MKHDYDPSLDLYVKAALGRKALGLVVLDVRNLTSVADVFIICSGSSNRQVTAIAEFIQTELKKSWEKIHITFERGGQKRRALGFARLWTCDYPCVL